MKVCVECGQSFVPPVAPHCTCGGQLRDRGEDILLGETLGSYRLAKLIGEGGMGLVYKAVNPEIGSRVAIKVLSRDCAGTPDLVERFFAEARAANLIRHENIINILDLARLSDDRPYIIMEYLDGAPLGDIIKEQGALPLGTLARLAGEVLDALGAAHAKPIVHRDLKPDNIFISPQGRAKVLDFGIAKLRPELSGRAGPTQTGSLMGTPHYMSPEQAIAKGVDTRTDIYAMGVILYEAATGRRPFSAESLYELLRMHIEFTPASPVHARPDMPPEYAQVILRALAKDPAMRFQSAAEMKNALMDASRQLPETEWRSIVPGAHNPGPGWSPSSHGGTPITGQSHPSPRVTANPSQPPIHTAKPVRPNRKTGLFVGLGILGCLLLAVIVFAQQESAPGSPQAMATPGQPSRTEIPALQEAPLVASGSAHKPSHAVPGSSPGAVPDQPSTNPDRQLAAKLNDIVECATDGGAYRSRARYLDWADAARGPSGKERYISYGLYTMSDPASCAEKIARMAGMSPSMPELENNLQKLSDEVSKLTPIVNEASEYYEQEDYKDDGAKKGKELHPQMMRGFAAVQKAHTTVQEQLRKTLDALADREMKRANEEGDQLTYLGMKLVREARDLTDLFKPMQPGKIATLDLDTYSERLDRYLDTLDKLGEALKSASGASEDLVDDIEDLLEAGKKIAKNAKVLRRRAQSKKTFSQPQRSWLGTSSGWMATGSPDSVMNAYRDLVRSTWRPELAKRVLMWEVQDPRYYERR